MKKLYKSKTFWTGIGTIVTSIGFLMSGEKELQEVVLGAVGFIFIVLRLVTYEAVEKI